MCTPSSESLIAMFSALAAREFRRRLLSRGRMLLEEAVALLQNKM